MYQNVKYFCKTKLFLVDAHSTDYHCWYVVFFFPDMKRRFIVKCMIEIRNVIELTSSKYVTT